MKRTPLIDNAIPDWVEAPVNSPSVMHRWCSLPRTQIKGVLERLHWQVCRRGYSGLRSARSIQTRFTIKAPIDGVITAFDLHRHDISKEQIW
ncbi:hypothetical protein KCP78_17720 [Salmonella enterica subsp. enterica]|nr:hypothetical protein KCP78_17720 [Salmonella enterica subsp. enterica]